MSLVEIVNKQNAVLLLLGKETLAAIANDSGKFIIPKGFSSVNLSPDYTYITISYANGRSEQITGDAYLGFKDPDTGVSCASMERLFDIFADYLHSTIDEVHAVTLDLSSGTEYIDLVTANGFDRLCIQVTSDSDVNLDVTLNIQESNNGTKWHDVNGVSSIISADDDKLIKVTDLLTSHQRVKVSGGATLGTITFNYLFK